MSCARSPLHGKTSLLEKSKIIDDPINGDQATGPCLNGVVPGTMQGGVKLVGLKWHKQRPNFRRKNLQIRQTSAQARELYRGFGFVLCLFIPNTELAWSALHVPNFGSSQSYLICAYVLNTLTFYKVETSCAYTTHTCMQNWHWIKKRALQLSCRIEFDFTIMVAKFLFTLHFCFY